MFIFGSICALYTCFPNTAIFLNQSSAQKALIFESNRPHTGEENYFEKVGFTINFEVLSYLLEIWAAEFISLTNIILFHTNFINIPEQSSIVSKLYSSNVDNFITVSINP